MTEVVLYTRAMCGYCSRAKRLLTAKGVAFEEIDATFDRSKRVEMIEKAHGRTTFPQIFIGDRHIGGSDELYALERAGELDRMLQPA